MFEIRCFLTDELILVNCCPPTTFKESNFRVGILAMVWHFYVFDHKPTDLGNTISDIFKSIELCPVD